MTVLIQEEKKIEAHIGFERFSDRNIKVIKIPKGYSLNAINPKIILEQFTYYSVKNDPFDPLLPVLSKIQKEDPKYNELLQQKEAELAKTNSEIKEIVDEVVETVTELTTEQTREASRTLLRLNQTCSDFLEEFNRVLRPQRTGRSHIDNEINLAIEEFLTERDDGTPAGVHLFAEQIGQLIHGLEVYAKLNKNMFGHNNHDLETVEKTYKELIEEIRSAKGIKAAQLCNQLVTCCDIVLTGNKYFEEPEVKEPTLEASNDIKEQE